MKNAKYYRASRVFYGASITLLSISIISACLIVFSELPLKPSLDHQGFENFLIYFGFPVKILAAAFATFTIWLTLEMMYDNALGRFYAVDPTCVTSIRCE